MYTSFPIWRWSLGRVTRGESRAIPGDERRRDNNISVSFSFEKYTFFRTLKMFSTYPLRPFWLSNDRVRFSAKLDPINLNRVRLLCRARFNNNSTRLQIGPGLYRVRLNIIGSELIFGSDWKKSNSITQKPVTIRKNNVCTTTCNQKLLMPFVETFISIE